LSAETVGGLDGPSKVVHLTYHRPMKKDEIGWVFLLPPPAARLGLILTLTAGFIFFPVSPVRSQSLRGSTRSVDLQFRVAHDHDFTFLESPAQVERFVKLGYLVPVRANRYFELHSVSYPFARPETRTFILRLSEQYHRACGEKLVVTSLTRPQSRQPNNASSLSVHPTGMAADIRRTNNMACRSWLENVLLSLEKAGVLEATRETYPPHYHVALFPKPYARYVAELSQRANTRVASADVLDYQVRRGDSLWDIARSHGTTVDRLKEENELSGSRIYAGQVLKVPVGR
jgi:LysM repeat protein